MQAGNAGKSAMSKFGRLVPPPVGSHAAVQRALPQIASLYRCAPPRVGASTPASPLKYRISVKISDPQEDFWSVLFTISPGG